MEKKLALVLTVGTLSMSLFVGCGASSDNISESTETVTEAPTAISEATTTESTTPETTEAPHEHTYVDTVVTSATCEEDGVMEYVCDCGDSYTETIPATGHTFETYTSNNDATYLSDGTETATCLNCGETDTRTAEGSMLTYTYTDMDATMYAQQTVNVRSMPSTDGEKQGSLSTNDEIRVTGQCNETGWYRIEYNGSVAYVTDKYVGTDKVVVQVAAPAQSDNNASQSAPAETAQTEQTSLPEFPYPLYQIIDEGGTNVYFYVHGNQSESDLERVDELGWQCVDIISDRISNFSCTFGYSDEITGYNGTYFKWGIKKIEYK